MSSFRITLNINKLTSDELQIRRHCDVAMSCNAGVMDIDGRTIILNQSCTVVTHRFVSTIGTTIRGPVQGHNGKFINLCGSTIPQVPRIV